MPVTYLSPISKVKQIVAVVASEISGEEFQNHNLQLQAKKL